MTEDLAMMKTDRELLAALLRIESTLDRLLSIVAPAREPETTTDGGALAQDDAAARFCEAVGLPSAPALRMGVRVG